MSVVFSSTLSSMAIVLPYILQVNYPLRVGRLLGLGFMALAVFVQSFAWASQSCHALKNAHSLAHSVLHPVASGHEAKRQADHSHVHTTVHSALHGYGLIDAATKSDVASYSGGYQSADQTALPLAMLAHSCAACAACCPAALAFLASDRLWLLDLRDPGPASEILVAQPLPPHDPPFHPPRSSFFL